MNVITATDARSNFFQLLKDTIKGHLFTHISSKEGNAVIMSEEDFESLVETAELLSVPGLLESVREAEEEIKRGETYSFEEVFGK